MERVEGPADWYRDAVIYELYVRAFRDSNGNGHGDLRGVIEKLDHLVDLGVDCVWILPTYPSPLEDDGYDVADFYGVHPDYGTLADLEDLFAAAHERGLRVMTDLVMNHTSRLHPWFIAARRPSDPMRDWYVWSPDPERYSGARVIFTDSEDSNWAFDEESGEYYWHRFFSAQPDLNYDNPAVRAEMLRVVEFWLERGIDGFRLDAIPYLYEREGTDCENLSETHGFLKEVRSFVDERFPGALLLGEVNQWPEETLPYFGDGRDELMLLYHFPVMPRLYKAVAEGKRDAVEWIMDRTPAIPDGAQWAVFLRNHDELTLEMVTDEERAFLYETYAPEPAMKLNVGIRRRLFPLLGNDRRKAELMNSMLMTLPGTPIIYYGDEIGMGDDVTLPDRHGVRTPMQWDATPGAGFSSAAEPYVPVIDDSEFGYRRVNVADQRADPVSYLNWMRRLIRVRKAHPALGRGSFEILRPAEPEILAFLRVHRDDVVVAVHNLSGREITATLDLGAIEPRRLIDAFDDDTVYPKTASLVVTLPPYGYRWLASE